MSHPTTPPTVFELWLAKYIELHGGKFEVLTDYYPRYKDTHQISSLACNKHSKATVEVYKGKVLISMGPSKQDGKYGFSPRGTSLKKFAREVVNFMANNIPDLDLENFARHPMWYIIAGDLTFDDPRVSECLDRGPIPIEYGPYKLQANEYMVLRFDDHPWADDPQYNFANGQWCRRQEIRFLNKASFEVAEVVQDLMSRQVEDIQSGAAILSLVNRYESAMDHFDESLKRQELSAQELVFRSNKLLEYLDNLGYDLDFIKEQNAENILLSLLQRRDIDELGTNLEKKLLTGSGMIAGVADAVGNKMDRVGDLLERMLYQNEEAQTTRLENQELLIRQLGTMEEISQLLKEQKKEHFKWRSVDLGTKLTIIATLHQKLGSYEKVAKEINKEFEVSRQALDKLVRKYSSNNHGTNLENLGTKEKSGNFVKTGYLKPSDVPGDLNINENPGTISSPQLSGNFWRTGMKILEVLEGKELSKKAIYKLVGGNTSAFYNIINQMVEAGTLQERPDPGHKQRRLVSIRGEKA